MKCNWQSLAEFVEMTREEKRLRLKVRSEVDRGECKVAAQESGDSVDLAKECEGSLFSDLREALPCI